MKVLVTGANGYIGSHVTRTLLDAGCHVLAADLVFDYVDKRAERITCPLFSESKDIYDSIGRPDLLIHLAWRNGFVHNAVTHMADLSAHYIFITNMLEGGLRDLTVMGSVHEVGYHKGAVNENTQCNPLSAYGVAKNALRQAMSLFCQGKDDITFRWLRGYYITGDDQRNNSVFKKIIDAEKEGKSTFPFTTGKNLYDFIDVADLSRQIVAASQQKNITGIINCCSGKPISLADKVEEFVKANGFTIKLEYGAFPDREYDSPGIWGDNRRINAIMYPAS